MIQYELDYLLSKQTSIFYYQKRMFVFIQYELNYPGRNALHVEMLYSLHIKAVSDSKFLSSHNCVLQTASPQVAPEEANLPRPYKTILSQLCSYFCSSLHSYRERIDP